MHYPTYKTVVIVFLITAAWDVALRFLAQGDVRAFGVERMRWVLNLRPYFEQHTLLSAALVAGFVGAVTLPLITATNPFRESRRIASLGWVALVSGAVGFPMKHSGLFPHLKRHYYDPVPAWYSFLTDAFSGVVVAATYHALLRRGAIL
jgi:hypothetical protein